MKLKLDLHDVSNRGQDIDRALPGIIWQRGSSGLKPPRGGPGKPVEAIPPALLPDLALAPGVAAHVLGS